MRGFHTPGRDGRGGPIYPAREDTELLEHFALGARGLRVLEIGTGNGQVAETAARAGAQVVATDLNPAALRGLQARARSERLPIEVVRTDLAQGLRRFDRILANPPYLPTAPSDRDPDRWVNFALDGGPDGCTTFGRIVAQLDEHLRPGGSAYLLESSLQDPQRKEELRAGWVRAGGTFRTVAERPVGEETLSIGEWRSSEVGRPDARGQVGAAKGDLRSGGEPAGSEAAQRTTAVRNR